MVYLISKLKYVIPGTYDTVVVKLHIWGEYLLKQHVNTRNHTACSTIRSDHICQKGTLQEKVSVTCKYLYYHVNKTLVSCECYLNFCRWTVSLNILGVHSMGNLNFSLKIQSFFDEFCCKKIILHWPGNFDQNTAFLLPNSFMQSDGKKNFKQGHDREQNTTKNDQDSLCLLFADNLAVVLGFLQDKLNMHTLGKHKTYLQSRPEIAFLPVSKTPTNKLYIFDNIHIYIYTRFFTIYFSEPQNISLHNKNALKITFLHVQNLHTLYIYRKLSN